MYCLSITIRLSLSFCIYQNLFTKPQKLMFTLIDQYFQRKLLPRILLSWHLHLSQTKDKVQKSNLNLDLHWIICDLKPWYTS